MLQLALLAKYIAHSAVSYLLYDSDGKLVIVDGTHQRYLYNRFRIGPTFAHLPRVPSVSNENMLLDEDAESLALARNSKSL